MPEFNFSDIEVCLGEPQANVRNQLRDALIRFGLLKTHDFSNIADTRGFLENNSTDLLIIDADQEGGEALSMVSALRHGKLGGNPYIGVIVTTWQPTTALLDRVTNSGADDLLIKPVSPKAIHDRITGQIEARKKFVVTADYVGPDRRTQPRPGGQQISQIDVPNVLRAKALGVFNQAAAAEAITRTNSDVDRSKTQRLIFQLAFLVELSVPGLQQPEPERPSVDNLNRMPAIVAELIRRLPRQDGAYRENAANCQNIGDAVERARGALGTGASAVLLAELRTLTYQVLAALIPDRTLDDLAAEVETAVQRYRERLAALIAARSAAASGQET